jgi:acyl dehydratase
MEEQRRQTGTQNLLKAEIGHEMEPVEMVITEEMAERHAWANEDYNPWYLEDSPFGGRIISPTFLAYDTDIMLWNYFALPKGYGLWAKQEFEFINALKVGKRIRITGRISDKIHKRGRDHITFEFRVIDEDGQEIVRMRMSQAFPLLPDSEKGSTR